MHKSPEMRHKRAKPKIRRRTFISWSIVSAALFIVYFAISKIIGGSAGGLNTSYCSDLASRQEVLTFGYSPLRSGSAESCLKSFFGMKFESFLIPGSEGAIEAQPLIIQGSKEPELFFLTAEGATFWGIHSKKILRQIPFPLASFNTSTPVVSYQFGKIYGMYFTYKNSDGYLHHLFSISLSNNEFKFLVVNEGPFSKSAYRKFTYCRTSLALSADKEGGTLLFGCSLNRGKTGASLSSENKGERGVVVSARVDKDGNFENQRNSISYFYPSSKTNDPESGKDGSVWMSGGAPTVLPDGNFLITTGNGKIDLEGRQYNCSMIQLDNFGKGLASKKGQQSRAIFPYQQEDERAKALCEDNDQDLSTSGVTAIVDSRDQVWLGLNGKTGVFRVLPNDYFFSEKMDKYFFENLTARRLGFMYGQPAAWKSEDGTIHWVSGANQNSGDWRFAKYDQDERAGEIRKIWDVRGEGALHRSSPAVSFDKEGRALVIFSADLPAIGDSKSGSRLVVLSGEDGQELSSVNFEGDSHFSMPTVFGNSVFLSTSKGIYQFEENDRFGLIRKYL